MTLQQPTSSREILSQPLHVAENRIFEVYLAVDKTIGLIVRIASFLVNHEDPKHECRDLKLVASDINTRQKWNGVTQYYQN
jgi:hypothetical protein